MSHVSHFESCEQKKKIIALIDQRAAPLVKIFWQKLFSKNFCIKYFLTEPPLAFVLKQLKEGLPELRIIITLDQIHSITAMLLIL